ncbi:MAG: hypothetical protein HXY29_14710 [Rhodocyclaceae bacterium]|nr:hypothetical protein [Rhodocyclaceae bacterium]
MVDLGLEVLDRFGEAALDGALDMERLDVAPLLGLAQRDEDVPAMPLAVTVHRHTRRTTIFGEYLAVAPGLVLKRDDVVLEKTHALALVEDGLLSPAVAQLQARGVFQHLVHALVLARPPSMPETAPQAAQAILVKLQQRGQGL